MPGKGLKADPCRLSSGREIPVEPYRDRPSIIRAGHGAWPGAIQRLVVVSEVN